MVRDHLREPAKESAAARHRRDEIYCCSGKASRPSFGQLGFALMRPFRFAVFDKLLEHWKTHFAVVQSVAKIASFIDQRRWYPGERHSGKLLDLRVAVTRPGIGQNRDVGLIGDLEFGEHRFSIAAVV